jgi:hypothetical protein
MLSTYVVITIIVCSTALCGYVFRLMFASKCTECNLGCLHLKRNVRQERKDVSFRLPMFFNRGNNNSNSPESKTTIEIV